MNKQELIAAIAHRNGATLTSTEAFVDTFMEVVKDRIKKGDEVKLVGFGTWLKKRHRARNGRNPQTGVELKIPARWLIKFRRSEMWTV